MVILRHSTACIAFLSFPFPFLGLLSSLLFYFPVSDFVQASLIKNFKVRMVGIFGRWKAC